MTINWLANCDPGHTAIIRGKHTFTYRQLSGQIRVYRDYFQTAGIQTGMMVGMIPENNANEIAAIWALFSLGAIVVSAHGRWPAEQIEEVFAEHNIPYLVDSTGRFEQSKSRQVIPLKSPDWSTAGEMVLQTESGQTATVLFTSGSSGRPKAVVHHFANHYFSAAGAAENMPLGPGDRWVLNLPLYHIGGLAILFRCMLAGATVVLPQVSDAPQKIISKYRVTHISMVSTQLGRMLDSTPNDYQMPSLKAILTGGGPIPDDVIRRSVQRNWPLALTYGSTEMASQIATTPIIQSDQWQNYPCRVLPYREVSSGENSELLVRGKTLCAGYLQKGHLISLTDKHGWYHSGDAGTVDENGHITVNGRLDTMFICGGENIHPEEIEGALLRIHGVERALVVPLNDPEFGQRPAAFIDKQPGFVLNEDTFAQLESQIARFKIPRIIFHWPQDVSGLKPSRIDFQQRAGQLFAAGDYGHFPKA